MSARRAALIGLLALVATLPSACGSAADRTSATWQATSVPTAATAAPATSATAASSATRPDWFDTALTDVRTGRSFSIADLSGKVVLIETMAVWCPTCVEQQAEVQRLHALPDAPTDLVSISLDVDLHEDEALLATYVAEHGYDWSFAVAPLEVARALGNLYSAQYLNPPVSPMLVIDRDGTAFQLPYGLKRAEDLLTLLSPYLDG